MSKNRRGRRKRHLAWEQAELASGGIYSHNLDTIARRYPALTPMELRVCALVKAMLPSWKIGEMLGITEKSVENYRVKIRRKIGCCKESLTSRLAKI
jgi:DNA-binding CsgD family transcriptional regulator